MLIRVLTGEKGLGVKTTKILYINVGNCQRIFENLKIDNNVLASLPVQAKKVDEKHGI